MGRQIVQRSASESNVPSITGKATEGVDEGCLSSPVGPDQTDDLSFGYRKADIVHRDDASIVHAEPLDLEQRPGSRVER